MSLLFIINGSSRICQFTKIKINSLAISTVADTGDAAEEREKSSYPVHISPS